MPAARGELLKVRFYWPCDYLARVEREAGLFKRGDGDKSGCIGIWKQAYMRSDETER